MIIRPITRIRNCIHQYISSLTCGSHLLEDNIITSGICYFAICLRYTSLDGNYSIYITCNNSTSIKFCNLSCKIISKTDSEFNHITILEGNNSSSSVYTGSIDLPSPVLCHIVQPDELITSAIIHTSFSTGGNIHK